MIYLYFSVIANAILDDNGHLHHRNFDDERDDLAVKFVDKGKNTLTEDTGVLHHELCFVFGVIT